MVPEKTKALIEVASRLKSFKVKFARPLLSILHLYVPLYATKNPPPCHAFVTADKWWPVLWSTNCGGQCEQKTPPSGLFVWLALRGVSVVSCSFQSWKTSFITLFFSLCTMIICGSSVGQWRVALLIATNCVSPFKNRALDHWFFVWGPTFSALIWSLSVSTYMLFDKHIIFNANERIEGWLLLLKLILIMRRPLI